MPTERRTRDKRRKLRLAALLLCTVASSTLAPGAAHAITNPTPDGISHPYVGVLVDDFNTAGFYEPFCTATLVAPTLMISSAHCFWGYPLDQVWVSFGPAYSPGPQPAVHATAVIHPDFPGLFGNGNGGLASQPDVAVLRLDEPVQITPAHLPPVGYLNSLDLRGTQFDAVGYGMTRTDKTRGRHSLGDNFDPVIRNAGRMGFHSLQPNFVQFSQNVAKGESGWCYGDSGGASFLAGTDIMLTLVTNNDNYCRARGVGARLDTASVQEFLAAQGVPLPD